MARKFKTIEGMTYGDLEAALTRLGYVRDEREDARLYRYPADKDALLIFPLRPDTDEVRGIDFLATRKIVDGFGILDEKDFDLMMIRLTGAPVPKLTY